MYMRPARPPGRHHDDDANDAAFRDALLEAIDQDPQVRAAILRLFAAQRPRRRTTERSTRKER